MAAAAPGGIGVVAGMRIAGRALAALALLLACIPLHFVTAAFTRHNPVPRLFFSALLRVVGVRLRVDGALAPGRHLLIANHVSWIDIPALTAATGSAFVAHAGLAEFAPLRWLCQLNRTVFVARHDRSAVAEQIEQVRVAMEESGVLTIFPEGTTADGSCLLPFKSSLLAALAPVGPDVAVQPVWIDYGRSAGEIAWINDEPGPDNLRRILARRAPITVTLHFLAPLSADERRDRKTIAAASREAIAARMDQRVAL